MSDKTPCIVLGSGNIGTDLMMKLLRSDVLELTAVVGIDRESEGLALADQAGLATSASGAEWVVEEAVDGSLVFEATSAAAHRSNAALFAERGLQCIDLTPAKLGPGVVPVVNLQAHQSAPDLNLISCGGQATIPMVAAIAEVCPVPYAEIVSTIASRSAGPGTRQNIDEFTRTTASGLEEVGGAKHGKAIIVLNPAEPPIAMRNTVYCAVESGVDRERIRDSVVAMSQRVAQYVPGYRLLMEPVFDEDRVAVFVEVEGAGDYLPSYAGNLDIMTSAAVRVGEELVRNNEPEVASV